MTTDLTATENTIPWPESVDAPPAGWHWGRHVSLGAHGAGYYLIRDRDDATLIAIQRPDLGDDDVPTDDEIEAALRATSDDEEYEWTSEEEV
jgi:hypothetical protein